MLSQRGSPADDGDDDGDDDDDDDNEFDKSTMIMMIYGTCRPP